jgi:hypothetical protein
MTSAVGQTSEKESSKTRWVAVFALVIWAFSLILLYPEKANFVLTRSWWHTVLGAILEISVPVLAILELRHSSEANTLRKQANQLRAEAIALEEQNAKLIAQLAEERNKHLQEIAKNTARPITPAEKNAGLLRKHLRATVAVSEGTHVWGNTPEIVEVGEDNTVTLFTASSHMSSNAWCVKLRCEDLEITDIPQGACPLRLTVVKRYGAPSNLAKSRSGRNAINLRRSGYLPRAIGHTTPLTLSKVHPKSAHCLSTGLRMGQTLTCLRHRPGANLSRTTLKYRNDLCCWKLSTKRKALLLVVMGQEIQSIHSLFGDVRLSCRPPLTAKY